MKQMNKEELIEYFIEQLGDNHVLGEYFSIEEIRMRLNQNINAVEYKSENGNIGGCYNSATKTINVSFEGKSPEALKEIIVHEMLHALSFSEYNTETSKVKKVRFSCF